MISEISYYSNPMKRKMLPILAEKARHSIKLPVSVIIPVKNESKNIQPCLRSVDWADQVFVVDSQSTDGTIEKEKELGATVVQFHY